VRLVARDQLLVELAEAGRAHHDAAARLEDAFAAFLGVNRTDARCLEVLYRSGQLTAGELGRHAHLTTGAVTAVLDRLERYGYLRRVGHPEDRRRVLVEATPRAVELAGIGYVPLAEGRRGVLDAYNQEELALVREVVLADAGVLTAQAARIAGLARAR
jgi:DNA-binding MarR family transcriptional regulator